MDTLLDLIRHFLAFELMRVRYAIFKSDAGRMSNNKINLNHGMTVQFPPVLLWRVLMNTKGVNLF
jgi:hypothetical protein